MNEKEKDIYHNLLRSAQIAARMGNSELYDKLFETINWMQGKTKKQVIGRPAGKQPEAL